MLNSDRQKRALVLAGGGITGFLYEVGVVAAYEETLANSGRADDFDIYVGTSAGAVLAALLANGASARAIFDAINTEQRHSRFYFEPRDIVGVGTRGLVTLMMQFVRAMFGTIARAVRGRGGWPSTAQLLADFQEHHPPGFYSTEVLEKTLCARFTSLGYSHRFAEVPRELYVSGTDIDTGEHLLFGGPGFSDVHICRAVAASCALPVFFRPIRIDDRDVMDGGVSEVSPVSVAVVRGARQILFVNPLVPIRNDRSRVCLRTNGNRCARLAEKGVSWIGEQAMRLMRAHCVKSELEALLLAHEDLQLDYLEPGRDETTMFEHNMMSFSASKEILSYGRESGRRFFGSPAPLTHQL